MDRDNYGDNLEKRLNENGLNGKELMQMLKSTNSFIAGSYALQVLIGERWSDSDLDIFTDNDGIVQYFCKFLRSYVVDPSRNMENYLGQENYLGPENKGWTKTSKLVEFHMPNGFTIQVIIIKKVSGSLMERVLNNFDIDVCKVGFDGVGVCVMNPQSIQQRRYSVDLKKIPITEKKYHRMVKYKIRGFAIINYEEFMETYRNYLSIMYRRSEKVTIKWREKLSKLEKEMVVHS